MNDRTKSGKQAAATGIANESRLLGALLDRGYNASLVDLPHSTYDIIIEHCGDMIRVQAKTASSGSVSFRGGTRGGVDRTQKSNVKVYTQSTKTSDIVIGIKCVKNNGDTLTDFYFVPTLYIESLNQGSISLKKIQHTKNDWDILKNCKNKKWVEDKFNYVS